jgi:hypothetical protein
VTTLDPPGRRIYLAGLIATWNERDFRYSRDGTLTKEQRRVVIEWRKRETEALPEPERGLAMSIVREWRP